MSRLEWDTNGKAVKVKFRREECLHCRKPVLMTEECTLSSVVLEGGARMPGLAHKECHDAQA